MKLSDYTGGMRVFCSNIASIYPYETDGSLEVELLGVDNMELARELARCDDDFVDALFEEVKRLKETTPDTER